MIEQLGVLGYFDIYIKNIRTGKVEKVTLHNRIMDAYLVELTKLARGLTPDMEFLYLGVGTGTTAITNTDSTLATEIFRCQFVDVSKTATGEVTSTAVILAAEAVAEIQEIGIFAGSTATASANTGLLVSRALWYRNKTNLEEIQFVRKDIYTRV